MSYGPGGLKEREELISHLLTKDDQNHAKHIIFFFVHQKLFIGLTPD